MHLRVVHVCRTGWPHVGGMESAVGGLASALSERGHEVSVVTLDRAPDGSPLPIGRYGGVRYDRVRRVGPGRYPLARGLVRRLRGADVVHAHGLDGLTDLAILSRRWHGAAVGVSTHGGYFHTGRQRLLKEAWLRTVTRFTLARAGAVWFTSEADRDRLSAARVTGSVVENGVDVVRFSEVERHPRPGRWLVPGRVDVHKGLDDLIDALAVLVRRDERPVHIDVVGPEGRPGVRAHLVDRATAWGVADRVRFHGEVDDASLRWLLGGAELALFPSRYEGFGMAVVEAMAAGVPVVVAAIPAFDRLVRDEVDGYRVDFREPAAAADRLAAVRDRDHGPVVASARDVAAGYGWDRRVVVWETAYRDLLSGSGR